MGIIAACIDIGRELRRTIIAKDALDALQLLREQKSDLGISLFLSAVDKYQSKHHFRAADYACRVIKDNAENPKIGQLCVAALKVDALHMYSQAMLKLAPICDSITQLALSPRVEYALPSGIKIPPRAIRAIHALAVSYQRTNLTRDLLQLHASSPEVLKGITDVISEYETQNPDKSAYTAGHFELLDKLSSCGFSEHDTLVAYKIMSAVTYMHNAVYYGFLDTVPTICESSDILILNSFESHGYQHVEFRWINPDYDSLNNSTWLFKLISLTKTEHYYQILTKTLAFGKDNDPNMSFTIKAVCLDWL